jgi:hypothetical protein
MPTVRQSSFGGGEFAPSFWGRTDIPRYAVGMRHCRNFYCTNTGSLQNRGGFEYCGGTVSNLASRLIPFQYSDTTGYLLEFSPAGGGSVSIWYQGSPVTLTSGYTILATPYAGALEQLRYVQSGDVLTLFHPGRPPYELKRLAHNNWTLTAVSFVRPAPFFYAVQPGLVGPLDTTGPTGNPAREWVYLVTTLYEYADGTVVESAPKRVVLLVTYSGGGSTRGTGPLPGDFAVGPGAPVTVDWHDAGLYGGPPPPGRILSWRVYRGRGALFGLVGETRRDYFRDVGDMPDYGSPPPQGRNPFSVWSYALGDPALGDETPTLVRVENPLCATYHDERLVLGGTTERPATVWGSRVGEYHNFDDHMPSTDDEGVELTLASRQREEVRWLLSKGSLLVGTSQNVWSLQGADGGPLSATTLASARVESSAGCAPVEPLVVGNSVLFLRDRGMGVRELLYSETARANLTSDVGLLSSHLLTRDNPVVQWAYVEEPNAQVWALRADGTLLCLTYSREAEMAAWTRHDTDGEVISIASVREDGADVLYAVVRRAFPAGSFLYGTRYYVERLSPHVPDAVDGTFLDCARVWEWDGESPNDVATGLNHLEGLEVLMVCDGFVSGPYTVPDTGELPIPIEGGARRVVVGLPYFSELETLELYSPKQEVTTRQKSVATVWVEVVASRGLYAGESLEDASDFSPWEPQTVEEGFGPPRTYTGRVEVAVTGRWGVGGRAALQQRLPLPLTVAAVLREVVFGG